MDFFNLRANPALPTSYLVDLYVCGHMHMYERVNPVLNGTTYQTGDVYVNPGVPVHVVQGTAGVFQDWNFVHPQPEWSAFCVGKVSERLSEAAII